MPSLEKYRKMRDFSRTREPHGGERPRAERAEGNSYVIQKHAARRLHYDFRLELDGVLLSWAIPKGPSLDPTVKRLAVETEPHPLEYGGFEGTIPKGEYGGGTVMVWDRGTWTPNGDARQAYEKGHLSFTLHGEKLRGAWHLVRTKQGAKDEKGWLLFKSRDEFARPGDGAILEEAQESVLTGRSMDEIAAGKGEQGQPRVWHSNRGEIEVAAPPAAPTRKTPGPRIAIPRAAKRAKLGAAVQPELATLVDRAPAGDEWLHELKFDGYRILARIEDGEVELFTRNGNDWTDRMPTLAAAFAKLDVRSALIDGELVALNERGLSDFQTLQNSLDVSRDSPLSYYAFDLLHLDGHDLKELPLLQRKELLRDLLQTRGQRVRDKIRLSEHVVGHGPEFFAEACKLGVEGIVSKRARSAYRPGRGRDWLKLKCLLRQEFVVVGFTEPSGSRSHFGALLLGVRRDGELAYAGRVGTGFSETSLREIHERLVPLERKAPAVSNPPRGHEARGVHWVKPVLVAEVAYTGFTEDGRLRHPTFQGLREDKRAADVKLEEPAKTPSAAKTRAQADERSPIRSRGAPRARSKYAAFAAQYPLTNPNKVLYPDQGITKRELLDYYALVAERMLPHVANRPLTLVRCPDGIEKQCFFQKHPGRGMPKGLRSVDIRESEGKMPYSVIDEAEGLFGLLQLGALEIHTWGSRADDFEHPDLLVFDLDPDPSVDFSAVIACARELREIFGAAKLETFVKTTGGKGLHVCVPIEPDLDWDRIKDFSGRIAAAMVQRSPDKYVDTQSKAKRKGKIFVDYLRNGRGATFIAPYSTRARANAPIAVPLEWDELGPKLRPDQFTVRNIESRLRDHPRDPFARMARLRQRLLPGA